MLSKWDLLLLVFFFGLTVQNASADIETTSDYKGTVMVFVEELDIDLMVSTKDGDDFKRVVLKIGECVFHVACSTGACQFTDQFTTDDSKGFWSPLFTLKFNKTGLEVIFIFYNMRIPVPPVPCEKPMFKKVGDVYAVDVEVAKDGSDDFPKDMRLVIKASIMTTTSTTTSTSTSTSTSTTTTTTTSTTSTTTQNTTPNSTTVELLTVTEEVGLSLMVIGIIVVLVVVLLISSMALTIFLLCRRMKRKKRADRPRKQTIRAEATDTQQPTVSQYSQDEHGEWTPFDARTLRLQPHI